MINNESAKKLIIDEAVKSSSDTAAKNIFNNLIHYNKNNINLSNKGVEHFFKSFEKMHGEHE
jgi:hypothetical protein